MKSTKGLTRIILIAVFVLTAIFGVGLLRGANSTVGTEPVMAAAAEEHNHTWSHKTATPLTSAGGSISTGNYYLAEDVTLEANLVIAGTVNLCLNGHTLTGDRSTSTITVNRGWTLNLYDEGNGKIIGIRDRRPSSRTYGGGVNVKGTFNMYGGTITESGDSARGEGGGVYVDSNGKFNLYDGVISGNTASYGGGVSVNSNGTFTMYGGTIAQNVGPTSGGGVYVSGKFIMNGGTVSENISNSSGGGNGGGVYLLGGTFTMNGGEITGNTANGFGGDGGGVYMNSDGTFTMNGGTVAGNTAKRDGGGVCVNGAFNVSGNATVTKNISGGNVYLVKGKVITLTGKLENTAKIGVTLASNYGTGVFTSGLSNNGTVANFISDTDGYLIVEQDGEAARMKAHMHDGILFENVLTAKGGALEAGSYYLTENITLENDLIISGEVNLCLNGHTLTGTGSSSVVTVNGGATFNLYDENGGVITGGNARNGGGVNVAGRNAQSKAAFNMYGGTISGNEAISGGGGVYLQYGIFNMHGGSISANTAVESVGSGVHIVLRSSFTMTGGSITDNKTNYSGPGGGVYVGSGTFSVSGNVNITGNTMSRGAVTQNVFLYSDDKITIDGKLDPKAKIGVTLESDYGTGAFTSGLSGKGSIANFISDDSTKCVWKDGEELKIAGHVYSEPSYDGKGLFKPTCSENGMGRFYCVNECGYYEDMSVDAFGHVYKAVAAQAETCSDAGWKDHYKCSECKQYFLAEDGVAVDYEKDIKIAALGHEFTVLQHNAEGHWNKCVRCDETTKVENHKGGSATHFEKAKCSVCGEEYGEVIAHTYNQKNTAEKYLVSAATCEKLARYYYSCECGEKGSEIFEAGEYAAHKLTKAEKKDATCTEAGNIEYWTCSVCEKKFNADNEEVTNVTLPALNHEFTVLQHNAEGHWNKCVRCDETTKVEDHKGGSATHFEKAKCSVCGEEYGEVIAHTYNQKNTAEKYLVSAATCEKLATYYYSCECGEKGAETFEAGEYAAHKLTKTEKKDATCTEAGNIEYWTCSVCEKNFNADNEEVTNVTLPALDHEFTILQHNAEGHWNKCVRCDETTQVEDHKGGNATHFEKAKCSVCGEEYGEVIAHTYNQKNTAEKYLVSAATCEKLATYYYSCECGEKGSETFEAGEYAAHKLTKTEKKDATCTEAGNIEYWTCSVCEKKFNADNEEVTNVTLPALNHEFTVLQHNAEGHWNKCVRCDETTQVEDHKGGSATHFEKAKCSVCGEEYGEVIAHTYNQKNMAEKYLVSAATCEKLATYYYSCECGEKGTETFEAGEYAAHKLTKTEKKDATCTEAGNIEYWTCSVCEKKFNADNEEVTNVTLPALGHDLLAHEAKAATCTAGGWDAYDTCSRCDYTTYEEIPALGHDFSTEWTASAEKHWHGCSRCDEISAEGSHHWNEGIITKQPTEAEKGEKEFTCNECGSAKTEEIPATGENSETNGTPAWVWVLVGVGASVVVSAVVVLIIFMLKKNVSREEKED